MISIFSQVGLGVSHAQSALQVLGFEGWVWVWEKYDRRGALTWPKPVILVSSGFVYPVMDPKDSSTFTQENLCRDFLKRQSS